MPGLVDIELNKADQAKLNRMLNGLMQELNPQGLDRVMRYDVHEAMKKRISMRFAEEGDTTVGGWAPLSEATQNIRYEMGFAPEHPINVRTGALRRFVQSSFQVAKSGNSVELIMPGAFTGQTMEDKFRKAQQGKAPRSKIVTVPRPVLAIGQAENDLVSNRLKDHIERILKSL